MFASKRVLLNDLNPHIMCVLCGGYLIQATTVIECLHSFCKSCILNFLETSDVCPICDVQVHKTWPLLNIRLDQTLQSLVYKLVPGLFQDEMRKRREYHWTVSDSYVKMLNLEERGDAVMEKELTPGADQISLVLQMVAREDESGTLQVVDHRYLLCPSEVTIAHLKKFVRMKFGLNVDNKIVMYKSRDEVTDDLMLQDVAIIYAWKREEPMNLFYTVARTPFLTKSWSSKTKTDVLASVSTAIGTFLAREDSPVTSVSVTKSLPKLSPSLDTSRPSDKVKVEVKSKPTSRHTLSSDTTTTLSSSLVSSCPVTFLSSSSCASSPTTTVISSKCSVTPSLPSSLISSSHKRSTPCTTTTTSKSSSSSSSILLTSLPNSTSSSPMVLQTTALSSTGARTSGATTPAKTLPSTSKATTPKIMDNEKHDKIKSVSKRKAESINKSVSSAPSTLCPRSRSDDIVTVKHHHQTNSLSSTPFSSPTSTRPLSSSYLPRSPSLSSTTKSTTTSTTGPNVPLSSDGCNTVVVNAGINSNIAVIQPKITYKSSSIGKVSASTHTDKSIKSHSAPSPHKLQQQRQLVAAATIQQMPHVTNTGKPNSSLALLTNSTPEVKSSPNSMGQTIHTVGMAKLTPGQNINGTVMPTKHQKKSSHNSGVSPMESSKSPGNGNRTVSQSKNHCANPVRQVKSTLSMPSVSKGSLNSMKIIHSVESILSQTPKQQDLSKTFAPQDPIRSKDVTGLKDPTRNSTGVSKDSGKKTCRVDMVGKEMGKGEIQSVVKTSKESPSNKTTPIHSKVVVLVHDEETFHKQKTYPQSQTQTVTALNSHQVMQQSYPGNSHLKLSSEKKAIVGEIKHYFNGHENKHTTLKNKFDYHNVPSYNVKTHGNAPGKTEFKQGGNTIEDSKSKSSHIPMTSSTGQTPPVLYKSISCDDSQTRSPGISSLEKRNWKKRKLSEIDQELTSSQPPDHSDWANKRQCVTPDAYSRSKFGYDNTNSNGRSNTLNTKTGNGHAPNSNSSPSLSSLKQDRDATNRHRHISNQLSSFTSPFTSISPSAHSVHRSQTSQPAVVGVNTAQRLADPLVKSNPNSLLTHYRSPRPSCTHSNSPGKRCTTTTTHCNHDSNNNMHDNHKEHDNKTNHNNNSNNSHVSKSSESNTNTSGIYSSVLTDLNSSQMKPSTEPDKDKRQQHPQQMYEVYNCPPKKPKVEDICIDVNGGIVTLLESSSSSSSQASPSSTMTSPRSSLTSPGTDATSPGTEDRPDTAALPECRTTCEGTTYAISSILTATSKPSTPLDLTNRQKKL